ncbi:hypothetical protein TWF694_005445 [Orbilia ellipsospora]|uniref:Uncharacterized protein n=1 Tax=Orbilia ellipsospora TaxID=2528407 RepID=A0AAV9WT77_9PEZI
MKFSTVTLAVISSAALAAAAPAANKPAAAASSFDFGALAASAQDAASKAGKHGTPSTGHAVPTHHAAFRRDTEYGAQEGEAQAGAAPAAEKPAAGSAADKFKEGVTAPDTAPKPTKPKFTKEKFNNAVDSVVEHYKAEGPGDGSFVLPESQRLTGPLGPVQEGAVDMFNKHAPQSVINLLNSINKNPVARLATGPHPLIKLADKGLGWFGGLFLNQKEREIADAQKAAHKQKVENQLNQELETAKAAAKPPAPAPAE